MAGKIPKLVIIDGNALVHRAWHALPPTMRTKDGEIINAVYGFTMILLKVLKDLKPDYLAVTFDLPGPTFRHDQFKDYKATRVKQDQGLYDQFPRIKEVVRSFDIPIYEKAGFEADDVIATLARHPDVEKIQSVIVTGDLDTLQLVDENTYIYTMHKGMSDTLIYDIEQVKTRYDGLTPEQIVDFKALRGDPSDNIPGVQGIGEKGAIGLLKEFKTLENLYKNLDSPKLKERHKKLLEEHKDNAMMSQELATLIDDVKIKFNLEDTRFESYDISKVMPLFQALEFKSLIDKLPKENRRGIMPGQNAFDFSKIGSDAKEATPKIKNNNYTLVDDNKKLESFLEKLSKQKVFAIDTETSGLDPLTSKLLGISFSWKEGEAYYLPTSMINEKTKKIIADDKIKKIGHNIKFDLEVLENADIKLEGISFDTMIASYLINPGNRQHGLDGLVFTELGHQMQPIAELIGKGKDQITLKEVPLQKVSDYACEDADFTWRLVDILQKELKEKNNLDLFEKIEMPLIKVLAEIETNGITLDVKFLENFSDIVGKDIIKLEKNIFKLAGTDFNIASPLQLKQILFDRLEIPTHGLNKTKTGVSTAASELEKIKGDHKIIKYIIEYRELAKLKSTYLDALPKLVNKNDGRVHASFNQTVAATGRLSSSNPNLQNIPVRTELGQKIRRGFVAPKDYSLVAVDYSQIELRIVASLANDKKMIEAFKKGEDIHTSTAAAINGVKPEKVTKPMRYAAKAINFGIIYGQGSWGLSEAAGISKAEAQEFIDKYFEIYKPIKKFLEKTKTEVSKKGFAETWFGRRRYLPEINSSNRAISSAAERAAINHPVQGTAADLMKLAMIKISDELPKVSPSTKMILQVHDELVFEVPNEDIKKVAEFVTKSMKNICKLTVPAETHVSVGKNWGELKSL